MSPPSFAPPASETLGKSRNASQGSGRLTRITIGKVRSVQRQVIRTGALPLVLRTNGTGHLAVSVAARLGGAWRRSDHRTRTLDHAGSVHLMLHLSTRARAYLAAKGTVRIRITATCGHTVAMRSILLRMR